MFRVNIQHVIEFYLTSLWDTVLNQTLSMLVNVWKLMDQSNHIDGSVQDCSISTANTLELQQACAKLSTYSLKDYIT